MGHRSIALALGLLASTALASPAFAQTTAPRFVGVDERGVDLSSGLPSFSLTEGSIGSGEGAVAMERYWAQGAGWTDNWSGGMYNATINGATKTVVLLGPISDIFTPNGSTWTSDNASGATLVETSPGIYTYTARDGTRIEYGQWSEQGIMKNCPGGQSGACNLPNSLTKPNGVKYTIAWGVDFTCVWIDGECVLQKFWKRLASVTSSAGYKLTVGYATNNIGGGSQPAPGWLQRTSVTFTNLASAPSPLPTITYAYPSTGVTDVTDPGGRAWRLTTTSDRLTGIRRPGSASNNVTYAYNASNLVSSATKDGVTATYSRSDVSGTRTTTVTNALSQQTVVTSNLSTGRISSVRDGLNRTTSYQYDANARLTRTTLPEGNYVQLTLDARGNATESRAVAKAGSGLADIVSTASFDASCANPLTCNQPGSITDARSNVTDFTYDATHGGVLTVTAPAPTGGAVRPQTRYSYTSVAGAGGQSATMLTGVSACQTLASCTGAADETKTTAGYNSNLLPTTTTSGDGTGTLAATTTVTYDPVGNLLTVDGPLAGTDDTTTFRYDSARQRVGTISPDPDGAGSLKRRAVKVTYRPDGQVSRQELGTVNGTTDPDWAAFVTAETVDVTFDSNNRPSTQKLSGGGTAYALTQMSYDALGRLDCSAVRMNTAIYGSLPASACTLGTQGGFGPDRIGKTIYDAAGQVTQQQVAVGTTDAATERTLTWLANGQLWTLTDAENNKTTYVYDGHDRLAETHYPDTVKGSGTSSATDYEASLYDANGNVVAYRNRGGALFNFTYDNLNRVTFKNLPGAEPDVTYGYDNLGRQLTAKFSTGGQGITNIYDALSRRTSSTTDVGGTARALSYEYDLAGRRTKMTWWDGVYVNYDRLVTGELSKVRLNGATSGAGVLATFGYNDLGRRASLTHANGATTSYGYDAVSRLASLTYDVPNAGYDLTVTNSYNPASQIASQTRSNDFYAWTGHYNVNRGYTSNGLNQHSAAGPATFAYDTNGNLTSDGTSTFVYDVENKLTSVTSGGTTKTLTYDPLNRLESYNPGAVKRFIYDGAEAVAELDGSGNVLNRYVRGDGADELLTIFFGSGSNDMAYVQQDERGSTMAMTTGWGDLWSNRYDEYGVPASGNVYRFQYTGQMWLPEIGVYNYKARIYSPTLGRFLQTDPIGYEGGINLYAYVGNDAINSIDPLGLIKCIGSNIDTESCENSPDPISCVGNCAGFYGLTVKQTTRWTDELDPRLGTCLQAACFANAAFAGPTAPADNPWSSDEFVHHYYFGQGETVDLGDVGLGDAFRYHPSVQNKVGGFATDVMSHQPGTFSQFGTAVTDVRDTIFSVGRSTLYMQAYCTTFGCDFNFGINDSFRDVFGVGVSAGGTPYRIIYRWQEYGMWPKSRF